MQKLILTPFEKAIKTLGVALEQPKNEFTRDATIQRFEYTFELAWKMLKRYLSLYTEVNESAISNIFRHAAKQGLIDDVSSWFNYCAAWDRTSHEYSKELAEEVYPLCSQFFNEVKVLYDRLTTTNSCA